MLVILLTFMIMQSTKVIANVYQIPHTGLPPVPRISYGSAYSSDSLAIFGGQGIDGSLFSHLWLFYFSNYTWSQKFSYSDNFPCN